jgi:hypothetical protein
MLKAEIDGNRIILTMPSADTQRQAPPQPD